MGFAYSFSFSFGGGVGVPVSAGYHAQKAVSLLIEQYKDSPRLNHLVQIYAERLQDLEDTQLQVRECRDISTAIGVQLDDVGASIGVLRGGFSDASFRTIIGAKIDANWSDGTESDLMAILEDFYGNNPASYQMQELTRATIWYMLLDYPPAFEPRFVASFLHVAKAAGTRVFLQYLTSTLATTYTLSSSATVLQTSALLGLADDGQTTGGYLSGIEAA